MAVGSLEQEAAKVDSIEATGISGLGIREQRVLGLAKTYVDTQVAGASGDPAAVIVAAASKTSIIDADSVAIVDSAAANVLKRLTWANLKATLNAAVMTWTGKQTFSGGADLKGRINTVTAGTGIIGEKVTGATAEYSCTANVVSLSPNFINGVSLVTGHWMCIIMVAATAEPSSRVKVTAGFMAGAPGSETFMPILPSFYIGTSGQTYYSIGFYTSSSDVGIPITKIQMENEGGARNVTVTVTCVRYA